MASSVRTGIYDIIKYGTLGGIALGILVLIIASILVQDTGYIRSDPKFFMIEMASMGILTAVPIVVVATLRGAPMKESLFEFFLLFLKIVILHLLMQTSGVYSIIFPNSSALVRNICTDKVYKLIKYGIIGGIGLGLLILVVGSALVRDTYYITKDPKFFTAETLTMGVLSAIPIIGVGYLRKAETVHSLIHGLELFAKMAIIHIGMQLSGVYSILFPESADPKLTEV